MKHFIEKNTGIVSAMNFHAWGDLWIFPYNYIDDKKDGPLKRTPKFYNIYKDFSEEAPHQAKA
jgi:hypothetical protein